MNVVRQRKGFMTPMEAAGEASTRQRLDAGGRVGDGGSGDHCH